MKLYHYDGNGFLTYVSDATNIDPLESEKQGQPVYTIPASATSLAPPNAPAGKVAYFDTNNFPYSWKLMNTPVPPENPDPVPTPPVQTVIPTISKRQFWQQIGMIGWIERAEALSFMQTGTLPAVFEQAVQSLDAQDPTGVLQFKARMAFMANEYERNNAFVPMIGQLFDKTEEQIDALFLGASQAV